MTKNQPQRLSHDQVTTMLKICEKPQSRSEVLDSIGYSNHTDNYKKYLKPLIDESLIELTIPDTPRSSNQKYKTTKKGILFLKNQT